MTASTTRSDVATGYVGGRMPRSLPRKRTQHLTFRGIDLLWMSMFAILPNLINLISAVRAPSLEKSVIPGFFSHLASQHLLSAICFTLIGPVVYLSLQRNRDKAGPLIAAFLCASSVYIVHSTNQAPFTALFMLILIAAYACISLEIPVAGAVLLAFATALRIDGAAFGAGMIGFLCLRRAKGALPTLITYSLLSPALLLAEAVLSRVHPFTNFVHARAAVPWLVAWASSASFTAVWWFLFPFLGEMTSSESRQKYMPIVVSLAAYFCLHSAFVQPHSAESLLPAVPFLNIVVAIGIARVIPVVAGDISGIGLRYTVATVAVVSVLIACFCREMSELKNAAPKEKQAAALSASITTEFVKGVMSNVTDGKPPSAVIRINQDFIQNSLAPGAATTQVKKQGRRFQ